ncbi:MAG: tRNA nucleotidyltransferase, partial [Firmicutes bacterium]|nr:tRNA nucleotidyltransferase [Bacillota bacterium]
MQAKGGTIVDDLMMARNLALAVRDRGGRAYFVGGYVRDGLMGIENNDIDIEIHGISASCLEAILSELGKPMMIGKSFGVFHLKGYDTDISLAEVDGTFAAAKRRDLTCNALMRDVLSDELIDHFGGEKDLRDKILRHCDEVTFREDPLRVLRVAGFAARFGFTVAEETMELCRKIDLSELPRERVDGELRKVLLRSERPSVFFEVLRAMGQLDIWFPELKALIGVAQNPKHHTEGDVWTHTMLVLDQTVTYRNRASDPYGLMLSALSHDFGKAICTEIINGEIHSYQHEIKGLPLVEDFLCRLSDEKKLHRYVLNMVELHMRPNFIAAANASVKATNKMFDKSAAPEDLLFLSFADGFGTVSPIPYVPAEDYLYER